MMLRMQGDLKSALLGMKQDRKALIEALLQEVNACLPCGWEVMRPFNNHAHWKARTHWQFAQVRPVSLAPYKFPTFRGSLHVCRKLRGTFPNVLPS